jgi:hypothetical protein
MGMIKISVHGYILPYEVQWVSEQYCYHALMGSAANGCAKQPPYRNIHLQKQSWQDTRLRN